MNSNDEWNKGFIEGLKCMKTKVIALEQELEDYIRAKELRLQE